ncbi:hypothetical protein K490DRAFT_43585 [Saccharata proteae CBS 121410]|uniref:GDS1 winged helix domain-containing protein n=1 Tax=Saccharata proteae CBS 121410 TaxID=1314787 RepID=A0A9P4LW54_9PEZI|nr:hypothetical protein K490DRAFT_43585 [Saccharata proteae CBS 121410]
MPYNTRRKSLSLPMLGIHLPNSSRSSSHRPPPATIPAHEQPPTKKIKRSHTLSSSAASSPSPVNAPPKFGEQQRPKSSGRVAEQTPPPSPGAEGVSKIDTEGIKDDIVVAVIQQLEETGNRPHLLKELAAVLATQLPIVERYVHPSANPSAIISSRLTSYIRRPWTALAPCPVGKELVGTHPKRIYFFLTTTPHQPIPEPAESNNTVPRIISPSLSSAADDDDDEDDFRDSRARAVMSPSPEVDLSSPELDDEEHASDRFSGRSSLGLRDGPHPPTSTNMAHNRRAVSPPLERDEREFTATASSLQQRSRSRDYMNERKSPPSEVESSSDTSMEDSVPSVEDDETEESIAIRNSEAAALVFGQSVDSNFSISTLDFESSPVLKPNSASKGLDRMGDVKMVGIQDGDHIDGGWGWSDWKSPEAVELDELDDLLGDY